MTRSTNSTSTSSDGAPKSPSILSKFAFPFASRKRQLAEFYIRAKDPHRQYSPGDKVEGTVVVTVTKPLRISHLVVCLHGFVKVYNSPRSVGQSVSRDVGLVGGGVGKRGSAYFGDGFASLFENEIALCGEGRLEPGSFEFQFSLELPSKGIPSGITFERGTISYMITSTLTRPTTISPIVTCERHIQFVETVDIAPLLHPKPRMVSVEMLSGKSLNKIGTRTSHAASTGEKSPNSSKADARKWGPCSSISTAPTPENPPRSPARSEPSSASVQSSTASSRQTGLLRLPSKSSNNSDGLTSSGLESDEVVRATIQLLQGGCLPGDKLPLEISVNHNRPVKSLQGIIITMYREGHVDTHPAIPLGPSQPGKKQQYEDYYPKSRSGLGGLSLSSAGTSSGFRKNLSQKIIPLIVDPQSLHATVKTSIQVPEDLFPTISSVPGSMISFKYFIEVVIDLGGRFTSPDRIIPRLNMTGWPSKFEYNDSLGSKLDASEGITIPIAGPLNFLNTEGIRREKGVVACLFEVVVGTQDSRRKRLRQPDNPLAPEAASEAPRSPEDRTADMSNNVPVRRPPEETSTVQHEAWDGPQVSDDRRDVMSGTSCSESYIIPPPEMEEELDEKARIRRAEQQLLPSAPCHEFSSGSTSEAFEGPSAPRIFDDQDLFLVQGHIPTDASASNGLSTSDLENDPGNIRRHHMEALGMNPSVGREDDKLELERRRLEMAASSPDDIQGSTTFGLDSDVQLTVPPTVPWLGEEYPHGNYEYQVNHQTSGWNADERSRENLPQYER